MNPAIQHEIKYTHINTTECYGICGNMINYDFQPTRCAMCGVPICIHCVNNMKAKQVSISGVTGDTVASTSLVCQKCYNKIIKGEF